MTDDALFPWIRAYRDEHSATSLDTRGIRRRVLTRAGVRQRRRLVALRFVLPVAATFIGSVALAASQGTLPGLREVQRWLGVTEVAEPPQPPPGVRRANRTPLQRAVPEPPPDAAQPPAIVPAPALSFDDLPHEAAPRARAPEATRDALRGDLAVYEKAHRLHFHGGDPGQALAAWDAYLASHPGGTFAPEARFNRAICLLRLGRRSEARSVLEPIAQQGSGAYGSERARALLDAMQ